MIISKGVTNAFLQITETESQNFGRWRLSFLFFTSNFSKTLNPKQEYPNLSDKGKSAPVRVLVGCGKTALKTALKSS
jgi:hypothetical protein